MNPNAIPRLKDVMFALAAAKAHGQHLGRLPLQKFIYLSDILAPTWRKIAKPAQFKPYLNGPYDYHIQNTVDALAFRGFVTVSEMHFRQLTTIESRYTLTPSGETLVTYLKGIAQFLDDYLLFQQIAAEVQRQGWQNIKSLVYAEPTYDSAQIAQMPDQLKTNSPTQNLSRSFLRGFSDSMTGPDGTHISRSNLVQMFFATLALHSEIKAGVAVSEVP